ncbi:MAG: hypothetical protein LDL07_01720 [Desulfarculus sp.]|nr:hypothetical protein [Desulfarculus sp.]
MDFVLFGGGQAGKAAAEALWAAHPDSFAGLVWDAGTGAPPRLKRPPRLDEQASAGQAQVLLCSGYGRRLQEELLQSFPGGAFNAHPSLLPDYRGRHAIQYAIAQKERELGVTIHRMTSQLDQGEHLLVRRRRFGLDWAYPAIAASLAQMAAEMLVELVDALIAGRPPAPLPMPGEAKPYLPRRQPAEGRVDWREDGYQVLCRVRAGAPGYPAFALRSDGSRVDFQGCLCGSRPGQVLISTPRGCLISTNDGVVWLLPNQPLAEGEVLL